MMLVRHSVPALAFAGLLSLSFSGCQKGSDAEKDKEKEKAADKDKKAATDTASKAKQGMATKPTRAEIPAPPDVAAPPADAKKTPGGVLYKVLAAGTGKEKPRSWDRVKVQYTGWTTDGKMFDSSVTKGRPGEFAVEGVVPGWSECMQTMVVGQKSRFWVPAELGYKDKPGRPQGMLVFDVELLEIKKMPEPPPVPKDVAAAPKGAKKTEKGVFYKVLKKGTGKDKPTATSKVKVD